jgi:DNA-binding MarR family transcriptional regulator
MSKQVVIPFETTLHVRDTCLCLHVQRAARALARRFDEALRPVGLTNGQFSLLMSLNRPVPAGLGGVANLLAMDRTTLTAALKPLERRGLLTVSIDPGDRRSRRLALTPVGMALLARALPVWTQTHAEIETGLPKAAATPCARAFWPWPDRRRRIGAFPWPFSVLPDGARTLGCQTRESDAHGAIRRDHHDLRHQGLRHDEEGAGLAGRSRGRLRLP